MDRMALGNAGLFQLNWFACVLGGAGLAAVVVTNEFALVVIGVCWAVVFNMLFSLTSMVGAWRPGRTCSPT